jgi:hypothetical protein
MTVTQRSVAIPGSTRGAVPGAKVLQPSDPNQRIKVSIYARTNARHHANGLPSVDQLGAELPRKRHYPTAEEFNAV